MEGYLRGVARELMKSFLHEGTVDLVPRYAVPLPLSVIADQLCPAQRYASFKR
jgi:cytochrome P450